MLAIPVISATMFIVPSDFEPDPIQIWMAIAIIPVFALVARRFHDLGWRATWAMVAMIAMIPSLFLKVTVLQFGGFSLTYHGPAWYGITIDVVQIVALFIVLRSGQGGPNRFGPDPRQA